MIESLPAVLASLLGRLGDRVELPGSLRRREQGNGGSRLWNLVLRPALHFPRGASLVAVGPPIIIALAAFHMRTADRPPTRSPRACPS